MGAILKFDVRQMSRRIVTVLLAWLVLNVLVLALFVRPRVREFVTLQEESRPRLEALAKRQAEVEAEETFVEQLRQAETDLATLREQWLGDRRRRMVPIQLELARLAAQFGINLERVQYQNSELPNEGLERFAMVVPLEAGYGNLRKFLQAVENSDKFLVVERVALGQGREGGALLQLNITLATYFDAPHLPRERTRRPQPQAANDEGPGRT